MENLKEGLLRNLNGIEGFIAQTSPVAGGTSLFHLGKEFAHFHHDTELDLRLTRKVIQALGLKHPEGAVQHPGRAAGSPWIEIRYEDMAGVQRAAELVRAAIKQL